MSRFRPKLRVRRSRWMAPGLTLVEATLSSVMVGLLIVAALNALGSAARVRRVSAEQTLAVRLATDMVSEIMSKPLDDGGSIVGASRDTFTDILDYDNWTSEPPVNEAGDAIAGAEGYERTVRVRWITDVDRLNDEVTRTGLVRIVVNVKRDGVVIYRTMAFRTESWDSRLPSPESAL